MPDHPVESPRRIGSRDKRHDEPVEDTDKNVPHENDARRRSHRLTRVGRFTQKIIAISPGAVHAAPMPARKRRSAASRSHSANAARAANGRVNSFSITGSQGYKIR